MNILYLDEDDFNVECMLHQITDGNIATKVSKLNLALLKENEGKSKPPMDVHIGVKKKLEEEIKLCILKVASLKTILDTIVKIKTNESKLLNPNWEEFNVKAFFLKRRISRILGCSNKTVRQKKLADLLKKNVEKMMITLNQYRVGASMENIQLSLLDETLDSPTSNSSLCYKNVVNHMDDEGREFASFITNSIKQVLVDFFTSPENFLGDTVANEKGKLFFNKFDNLPLSFDGGPETLPIGKFLFRYENLMSGTSKSEWVRRLLFFLRGNALEWFWDEMHKFTGNDGWASAKYALRNKFIVYRTDFDVEIAIRNRIQMEEENISDFISAVQNIAMEYRKPITEHAILQILKYNLKKQSQIELNLADIDSIDSLLKICHNYEDVINHYNKSDEQHSHSTQRGSSKNCIVCWNCQELGHSFPACMKQKRIFCYGCGFCDVLKKHCPHCSNTKTTGQH